MTGISADGELRSANQAAWNTVHLLVAEVQQTIRDKEVVGKD